MKVIGIGDKTINHDSDAIRIQLSLDEFEMIFQQNAGSMRLGDELEVRPEIGNAKANQGFVDAARKFVDAVWPQLAGGKAANEIARVIQSTPTDEIYRDAA